MKPMPPQAMPTADDQPTDRDATRQPTADEAPTKRVQAQIDGEDRTGAREKLVDNI